jgi:hypothetical protein
MCKDAVNRDSTCQSIFRRLCTVKKIEYFRFPVSRPDDVSSHSDAHLSTVPSVQTTCHPIWTPICPLFHPSRGRVIPSRRPSVHCSIRPEDMSFPSECQIDKHHPSRRHIFPSGPSTVLRSFYSSLHPSGHLSSPSGRPSVIDQLQILSKFRIWED